MEQRELRVVLILPKRLATPAPARLRSTPAVWAHLWSAATSFMHDPRFFRDRLAAWMRLGPTAMERLTVWAQCSGAILAILAVLLLAANVALSPWGWVVSAISSVFLLAHALLSGAYWLALMQVVFIAAACLGIARNLWI